MKKQYVQLWLTLVFILVLFPPASTGNYMYEGHMFIIEIGKYKSRPGGGYIEGQIVWSRLFFEAFIATVFVVILRAFDVFAKLRGRRSEAVGATIIDRPSIDNLKLEEPSKESHLSIEMIGNCIHSAQALGEIVHQVPAQFKQLRIVGYLFMSRLQIIEIDGVRVRDTANNVFKDFEPIIMMYESTDPIRFDGNSCNFRFHALDANLVLEIFPESLLTEYVVFGFVGMTAESGYVDKMLATAAVMDTFPAFNPNNSSQLRQFVRELLVKFSRNS